MKIINKLILLILVLINNLYAQDAIITTSGKTHSEARNIASRLIASQNLRIVGQNHIIDRKGNWTLILTVRSKYY
jgi:hypothetical protein